jgi:Arc/MetJ family transcription regulator
MISDRCAMRVTVVLDDELLARAEALSGLTKRAPLLREALKALIERESTRRLAKLGGSEPLLEPIRRHRPDGD